MPTKGHISNLPFTTSLQAWYILKLQRRLIPKQYLRRILNRPPPRIDKFLQEHFSEYPVRLLSEDGTEDDGDTIMTSLDVDGFLITVVDSHNLTTLAHAFRSAFASVLSGFGAHLLEGIESTLKGSGHSVAF